MTTMVTHSFTGVHIISKEFIDKVPNSGFLNIIDTYKELLSTKRVSFTIHDDIWFDHGTPQSLLDGHIKVASNKELIEKLKIDKLPSLYNKPQLIHDYSSVYTHPKSLSNINNQNKNCIICAYSNNNDINDLNYQNVLWINGSFEESQLESCIIWDDIKVKL